MKYAVILVIVAICALGVVFGSLFEVKPGKTRPQGEQK